MVRFGPVLVVLVGCSFDTTVPTPAPAPEIDGPQMVAIDAPPDATPTEACRVRYGTADTYELCNAAAASCTFYVHTNGSSCELLCTGLGGSCIEAYDGNCANISTNVRPCTDTFGDQVCNCRP